MVSPTGQKTKIENIDENTSFYKFLSIDDIHEKTQKIAKTVDIEIVCDTMLGNQERQEASKFKWGGKDPKTSETIS